MEEKTSTRKQRTYRTIVDERQEIIKPKLGGQKLNILIYIWSNHNFSPFFCQAFVCPLPSLGWTSSFCKI